MSTTATPDICAVCGTAIGDVAHLVDGKKMHMPCAWAFHKATQKSFSRGDRVRKVKGSSWHGRIVGEYATSLTPKGYCVESEREPGAVQIYPAAALTLVTTREQP